MVQCTASINISRISRGVKLQFIPDLTVSFSLPAEVDELWACTGISIVGVASKMVRLSTNRYGTIR